MQSLTRFLPAPLLLACLATSASAQTDPVGWQPTLESAQRVAAQTGRPLLVHFWADWCGACRTMEQQVLSRPDVAQAVQSQFVPVKVHVDHFPQTARQFGVSELPTDVIVAPQGQVLARISRLSRAAAAGEYLAQLNRAATLARGQSPPLYGGTPPRGPGMTGRSNSSQPAPVASVPPQTVVSPGGPNVGPAGPTSARSERPWAGAAPTYPPYGSPPAGDEPPPASTPPAATSAPPQAPTAGPSVAAEGPPAALLSQIPPGSPPLALDGCCPVTLQAQRRWVLGDPRWGVRHEGRTYLFAGPEQQQAFLADPDRYAPVLSGQDVVLAVDENRFVPGQRRFGVWYPDPESGRVFLFSSEDTLLRFHSPAVQRYLDGLEQLTGKPFRLRVGGISGTAARPPARPATVR